MNRIEQIDHEYRAFKLARKTGEKKVIGDAHGMFRSALSMALQDEARERGIPFESTEQLNKHLDRYSRAIAQIATRKDTAGHPLVQGVVQTAQRLVAPEEGGNAQGKDEAGRHELTNTVTQPSLRELAGVIRKNKLLHAADALIVKTHKDHVPFANYNPKVIKRPQGFVELPPHMQTHDPTTSELSKAMSENFPGATIKPAGPDHDAPLPLASLHSGAKKARQREALAPMPIDFDPNAPDDGAPLPLADVAEDAPGLRTRDRHAMIGEMVLKKMPAAEITTAIANRFAISHRAAKDTFRRWLDLTRKGLHAPKQGEVATHVEKLARDFRQSQVRPEKKEAIADLHTGVDPHIAGTRLAMHLIQLIKETAPPKAGTPAFEEKQRAKNATLGKGEPFNETSHPAGGLYSIDATRAVGTHDLHEMAKAALAGRGLKGLNGNIYAAIGRRLEMHSHPLAKAYNWHTMDRSMSEDDFMKRFMAKHLVRPEGMSDREFYKQALKNYARDDATKERGVVNPEAHAKFWARLQEAYRNHMLGMTEAGNAGGKLSNAVIKRLTDSMYRLHGLADDRETSAGIDASKDRSWRDDFKKQWANKYMKFSRLPANPDAADLATAALLIRLNRS